MLPPFGREGVTSASSRPSRSGSGSPPPATRRRWTSRFEAVSRGSRPTGTAARTSSERYVPRDTARMDLIRHPPSVVLIPVDGGELVLVRQSRPGSGTRTLELPSGKLEEGETPLQGAARELAEECGLAAEEL